MTSPRARRFAPAVLLGAMLAGVVACGGSDSPVPAIPTPATAPALPAQRLSGDSPLDPACNGSDGPSVSGSFFVNSEVEPFVATHPNNPSHLIATWQQDRWTNGGARALRTATSFDGGQQWTLVTHPLSNCAGGNAANGADYDRVSDPWVDIGPDGVAHAMGLAFSGQAGAGASNAMLARRSVDGGLTWGPVSTLVVDGPAFFNDKNSLSADPTDARYVFAVWDRLDNTSGAGPTWMARSVDAGLSWQPARAIYAPANSGQTIGNRIVVLRDAARLGRLVNFFTQIEVVSGVAQASLNVIHSSDKGDTWSAPVRISDMQPVGARDPISGTSIRDGAIIGSIAVTPSGALWVTWQDGRFSSGQHDAIAVSGSADGGQSWSAPVAINRVAGSAAFTAVAAVRADGMVGVMHYDLRPNSDPAQGVLAGAWLLTSRDGVAWSETPVWSPFDLGRAPRVDAGLFLGDYQGLVAGASNFLAVLALSGGSAANPSDIFALPLNPGLAGARHASRAPAPYLARQLPSAASSAGPAQRARVHRTIVQAMERRVPGWAARRGLAVEPMRE